MHRGNVESNRLYENKAALNLINVSLLLFIFLNSHPFTCINTYSAVLFSGLQQPIVLPPSDARVVFLVPVSAAQWSVQFPQSVFRRGPSVSAQLCLVYQHYWLQVMFWTESIWPLEGFKYIIVQRGTLWDLGYTARAALHHTLRRADKVAKKSHQDMWINSFYPFSVLCRF